MPHIRLKEGREGRGERREGGRGEGRGKGVEKEVKRKMDDVKFFLMNLPN